MSLQQKYKVVQSSDAAYDDGTSTWDIADIVGCHPDLVRKIRRQTRIPFDREATKERFFRLEQDLRDLRALVYSQLGHQRLNSDVASLKAS